jgi:hypothetical protein
MPGGGFQSSLPFIAVTIAEKIEPNQARAVVTNRKRRVSISRVSYPAMRASRGNATIG